MSTLVLLAVLFLAFANGANDTFKGVATIYGSREASFKTALWWAAGTTFAGALVSLAISSQMLAAFSGKGLLSADAMVNPNLALAVALGAASTVFFATRIGMPVSTTHALMGALIGGGLGSASLQVNWNYLLAKFVYPLLLAPATSFGVAVAVLGGLALLKRKAAAKEACVCVVPPELNVLADGTAAMGILPSIKVATKEECNVHSPTVMVTTSSLRRSLHFFSGGAVGFARGMNDTPKMAALLLLAGTFAPATAIIAVALIMTLGGLVGARKIAETMSTGVTPIDPGEGVKSNVVTSAIVVGATLLGSPVSTTHVSCGSIFGIGAVSKRARAGTIKKILASWVFTLPAAIIPAFLIAVLLRYL